MIAVSKDGAKQWQVKHQKADGAALLSLAFLDDRTAYAAGADGALLWTKDGGETWMPQKISVEPILQASFSDAQHGLIRTFSTVQLTNDGGDHWIELSALHSDKQLEKWKFVFALASLNATHAALMLKMGPAQFESQVIYATSDAGQTWKLVDIPNMTLYSFVVSHGEYWVFGTEVIHKDQPGGGYGVPVALHSADGEKWEHGPQPEKVLYACTAQGCLPRNGVWVDPFEPKPVYWAFLAEKYLTNKWAGVPGAICSVGSELRCAATQRAERLPEGSSGSIPPLIAPPPLGPPPSGLTCLSCPSESVIVTRSFHGTGEVELEFLIKPDGTVGDVKVVHTPAEDIGQRYADAVKRWIFLPRVANGSAAAVRTHVKLRFAAIAPR